MLNWNQKLDYFQCCTEKGLPRAQSRSSKGYSAGDSPMNLILSSVPSSYLDFKYSGRSTRARTVRTPIDPHFAGIPRARAPTLKLPSDSGNETLASELFCEEHHYCLSESINVRIFTPRHKDTHSSSYETLPFQPLLLYFYLPLYCRSVPDTTEPPSLIWPPMAACQPCRHQGHLPL